MSQAANRTVGFIGLGDMGAPMARNIAQAGFDLTAFDLREEALASLEEAGARRAASVAELAASVDVVGTCVLYDAQVREIFHGDEGIIANERPGLVALIHSTVYPSTVVEIAEAAREKGVLVVDAPVSGGRDRSRDGTLSVMVGADDEAFEQAAEILHVVSGDIFRVGSVGTGQVVKLGNNVMGLVNALTAMEAVRFVKAYGVDEAELFKVARVSSGASRAIENWALHDRYGVEHTLAGTTEIAHRLAKDLRYAVAEAADHQVTLPIIALCSQLLPGMYEERWSNPPQAAAPTSVDQ